MQKKIIYHIHTDGKFLNNTARFDNVLFSNIIFFISSKKTPHPAEYPVHYFSDSDMHINDMVKVLAGGDMVVFYGLCHIKLKILKKLPSKIKIIWRFFGFELYGKRKDLMFSKETYNLIEHRKGMYGNMFLWLRNIKRKYTNFQEERLFKKIDYIAMFCVEEYDFLQQYFKLPKLLLLNMMPARAPENINKVKNNSVILGNSRMPYNNHLELLDLVQGSDSGHYRYILFLNYGERGEYFEKVLERTEVFKNATVIQDFLSMHEFTDIYKNSSALVINSYRQMAMGNIFTALQNGVKIYLSEKNVILHWLKKEGFFVYSISELKTDLNRSNLQLTEKEMDHNAELFYKWPQHYTKADFNNKITQILQG